VSDGNGVPSASQDGEVVLTQYTIYERPADYPDGFVVRQWHVVRGRQPGDDSTIVETWT
jgi:hypothetical protein